MRNAFAAFAILLALVHAAPAQKRRTPYGLPASTPYGLPAGALVVETCPLALGGDHKRALVLWLVRPKKEPFGGDDDETYTCPDETRGSHYTGPTRVSLVDTDSRQVINTIKVTEDDNEGRDEFDVPYSIRRGGYYHVEGVPEGKAGKPRIMWLRDYNGDGEALEFALYDALACMPLETTLIGYSRKQDRVIQYPIHVEVSDGAKKSTETYLWMDYLFTTKPVSPGTWKYEIDYRGRGGTLDRHEIRYNARLERFEGAVTYVGGQ